MVMVPEEPTTASRMIEAVFNQLPHRMLTDLEVWKLIDRRRSITSVMKVLDGMVDIGVLTMHIPHREVTPKPRKGMHFAPRLTPGKLQYRRTCFWQPPHKGMYAASRPFRTSLPMTVFIA